MIDATQWFKPLRKNLGKKNCELSPEDIDRINRVFLEFKEMPESKIFQNEAFGYWKVRVERPVRLHSQLTRKAIESLRFASGDVDIRSALYDELGEALFDNFKSVRSTLEEMANNWGKEDDEEGGIEAFIRREVLPYTPDAWVDFKATKIGYEVSFTRHFYKPPVLRSLDEIAADIKVLETETEGLLEEIVVFTVQKFPFILDEISMERGRIFAIVIDEAHSSQGGKTTGAMHEALGGDPEDTVNDALEKRMKARKMLSNASYFAFTATPKNKTLELFGEALPPDAESKVKYQIERSG